MALGVKVGPLDFSGGVWESFGHCPESNAALMNSLGSVLGAQVTAREAVSPMMPFLLISAPSQSQKVSRK